MILFLCHTSGNYGRVPVINIHSINQMLHMYTVSVDIGGTLDVLVDQFGIQFQVRFLVRTLESTGDVLLAGLTLNSYFKAGEIC